MDFIEKLQTATQKNSSLLCVGLDPDPELMPEGVSVSEFNKAIIEATSDLVCAYKLNLAFYEVMEIEGIDALKKTIGYIPEYIPVIGDAKLGDIGNTAKAYAKTIFSTFQFDAATVSPYLGFDSIEPFVKYSDKETFILCRTSNPGAVDFQNLRCETEILFDYEMERRQRPLFEIVAEKAKLWNFNNNIGLVIGATYPEELRLLRQSYPEMPLLIPGIGAQGGELPSAVRYGVNARREKAIISSSRQIIYASREKDFAEAARNVASSLRDQINYYLSTLPAQFALGA
jgi:orotidine-5'-phosphate decarboxylase